MGAMPFGIARREARWDIRRELDDRGLTMADIARMAKVSKTNQERRRRAASRNF